MSNINKIYIEAKSINKNTKLLDSYFPGKYSLSPYRACEHACKYCDGRAERYYVEGDFEKDIAIRKNLPELFRKKILNRKERGFVWFGSGVSDPYQPVEAEEKLMPKLLEIVEEANLSVAIMTKSKLVMRDIEMIKRINEKNCAVIMFSHTFENDYYRRIFEPYASSVKSREEALIELKKHGIYTGILAMPFLPYISDSEENIKYIYKKASTVLKPDFIMSGCLTLRPGIQKETYMNIINDKFQELSEKYRYIYRENKISGGFTKEYYSEYIERLKRICTEYRFPTRFPHYVYKNVFPIYDELWILINHLELLYRYKGVEVSRLIKGKMNYLYWLLEEKKVFNRSRKAIDYMLEDKMIDLFNNGKMKSILKNDRLYEFLREVAVERKTFNYLTLKNV